MFKKTLQVEFKNTLRNAPLVPDSVSSVLNKEEIPSVQNIVLACNTPEVDLLQHAGGQNLRVFDDVHVFVLNLRKEPLMPTSCRKARLLLKTGRAVVAKRFPFTIQLTLPTGENKQNISCGVDSGYAYMGFSCLSHSRELIRGVVELDHSTQKRLTERRMYRRNRRNKLRYREPRFNNRKRSESWLPPSVERRYSTHLHMINQLKELLPISEITVEIGNFDIQKLMNPEISGTEYQQGSLYSYTNLKAFILSREKHQCQLCRKGDLKTNKWRLHHIISRAEGGTDRAENVALLHESCHKRLHQQGLQKQLKKNKQYKESTFMNIIKSRFQKDLFCETTFGYQTFVKRKELQLEKTHSNDAFVIAQGRNQDRSIEYFVKQKRRNNRSLQLNRKGFKPSIRRQRYKLQPLDLVKIGTKYFEVIGTHCCGQRVKLKDRKDISIKKIDWFFNNRSLIFKKI
jgi:hypothetical protein